MAKINKNVPCYKCERRRSLCHASCEEYKEYAQRRAARAEMIRNKKAEENMIDDVRFGTIQKVTKAKKIQTAWKG